MLLEEQLELSVLPMTHFIRLDVLFIQYPVAFVAVVASMVGLGAGHLVLARGILWT